MAVPRIYFNDQRKSNKGIKIKDMVRKTRKDGEVIAQRVRVLLGMHSKTDNTQLQKNIT